MVSDTPRTTSIGRPNDAQGTATESRLRFGLSPTAQATTFVQRKSTTVPPTGVPTEISTALSTLKPSSRWFKRVSSNPLRIDGLRVWPRPPIRRRAGETVPATAASALVTPEVSDRHGLHFYYQFVTFSPARAPCTHQSGRLTVASVYRPKDAPQWTMLSC